MQQPIYLDYNATTPVDERVLERMLPYFREHFGNPSSEGHAAGWIADEAVTQAREALAELIGAEADEIVFTGGAMGRMAGAVLDGRWHDTRALFAAGKLWALNDIAATGPTDRPLLTLMRGRSYVLDLVNETSWWHPIHLHGHHFRLLSRDGAPVPHTPWHDTALMAPRGLTGCMKYAWASG